MPAGGQAYPHSSLEAQLSGRASPPTGSPCRDHRSADRSSGQLSANPAALDRTLGCFDGFDLGY